jgi:LysM repeat protein
MSHGKSSRAGSSKQPPHQGGDGHGNQGIPSRPFSLPPGYYEYYGIRPPESAPGVVQAKRAGLNQGPSLPRGLLEYYGMVPRTSPEAAPGSEAEPMAIQAKSGGTTPGNEAPVQELATQGLSGSAAPLPYLGQIQRSFGEEHDLSGVQAHIGGPAAEAAQNLGAIAYATGNHVAFGETPSLHTAAHEAAHVVQQRAGVFLSGGMGTPGDRYEQLADAVADRVVQGKSASDLLASNRGAAAAQAPAASPHVQGKMLESPEPGRQIQLQERQEEPRVPRTYVVQRGDTLSAIAQRFGTTAEALARANNISDPRRLQVGQRLTIPEGAQPGEQPTRPTRPGQPQQPQEGDAAYDVEAIDALAERILPVVPEDMRTYAETAIPTILRQCAARGVRNANQVAYILATAQHESRFGQPRYSRSESLVEDHNPFRQNSNGTWSSTVHTNGRQLNSATQGQLETNYWDSAYGGRLGNERGTTDGRDFRGRGYVQLTGRVNYRNMTDILTRQGFSYTIDGVTYGGQGNEPIDLEAHPDHVNRVPELAARIMVTGMQEGEFTGRALGDYVNDTQTDFRNARRVVNGDVAENGETIADHAQNYAAVLTEDDAWTNVFRRREEGEP